MPIIQFLKTSDDTYPEVSADNPLPVTSTFASGSTVAIDQSEDGTTNRVVADTELPAAAALADATANPTTTSVGALGMGFNGTTWDRINNNRLGTLLASSARTASVNSADQTNYNSRGVIVVMNVTAASGTGGISLTIRGIDIISGVSYSLTTVSTAITATGRYAYELYPGSSTAAPGAGTGLLQQRTAGALPRTWRLDATHGDASSYTYSVSFALIL